MKEFDVVTFGSAVVDVFLHTDAREKGNLMCYNVGEKMLIKNLKFDIGGGATNTAVAFSRLSLRTGCICSVGDDENGRKILNLLKDEKISFLGKVVRDANSGYSVILDSKGGDRTILSYKGVNNKISIDDLNLRKIKTRWLYYSSLPGKSFDTQKKLASNLVRKGVKLAYNPGMYIIKNLDVRSLIRFTHVLIVNKDEAKLLSKKYKKKSKNLLENLHSLGAKIVVITDKNNPVIAHDGVNSYKLIPHKNIKPKERTGAGDAFSSGFVAGLIAGYSIEDSLKLGRKESESVILYFGAKNKLLRMKLK
ncbi:carbohydrate kinase family protein [Candidatus Pacearchaeota archaeon]|nr:carbohydrate kinase family protein [Candidatus Pacearchaeota archaeon]